MIQNRLRNKVDAEASSKEADKKAQQQSSGNGSSEVVTVITEMEVDAHDPGFERPTKPIGAHLSQDEANKLREQGKAVKEEKGKGEVGLHGQCHDCLLQAGE